MDRGLTASEEDLVEYVFHDIKARRAGILKALTAGNSTFFALIFSRGDAIFTDFWFFSCLFPLQILRISTNNAILVSDYTASCKSSSFTLLRYNRKFEFLKLLLFPIFRPLEILLYHLNAAGHFTCSCIPVL